MMFRLAMGCCVVGTLAFLSPVRQGSTTSAPADPVGPLVGATRILLQPKTAGSAEPAPGPTSAEAAQAALTDLIVRQAVAQGTARARETLAAALGDRSAPGPEAARARDTLTAQDRLPAWRGTMPKS